MKTFITSFFQIFFVAINTFLISKQLFLGVFICSTIISLLWSFNVAKIALSDLRAKIIYSFGAGCGAVSGLWLINQIV